MKLSEKGIDTIRHICWEYSHNYRKIAEEIGFHQFGQDDFEDGVILSTEDIKRIISALTNVNRPTDLDIQDIVTQLTYNQKQL